MVSPEVVAVKVIGVKVSFGCGRTDVIAKALAVEATTAQRRKRFLMDMIVE